MYCLSFTTLQSTSTHACALKGICCAPMTRCAETPYFRRRHTVAADLCRHSASFQYQMPAISIAAQIAGTVQGESALFLIRQSRTLLYSDLKSLSPRYRSNRISVRYASTTRINLAGSRSLRSCPSSTAPQFCSVCFIDSMVTPSSPGYLGSVLSTSRYFLKVWTNSWTSFSARCRLTPNSRMISSTISG